MPLRKFHTIEEMNAAERDRWLDSGDPRLAGRIRFVLDMPPETVISEITVLPVRETSWP